MENKSTEQDHQRPDGNRLLDASLFRMDLNQFADQIKNEAGWKTGDKNSITVYKSENLRIVLIGLHKEAELKKHTAIGTISVQVLEGKIRFSTEEESVELTKGEMIALHKQIPHQVQAIEESIFLLTVAVT